MTLILSDNYDQTTNLVIDWTMPTFIRLNSENFLEGIQLELNSYFLIQKISLFKNFAVSISDVKSFWYRRGDFVLYINSDKIIVKEDLIRFNLEKELYKLKDFLHIHCESKSSIGSYRKELFQNKLTTLFLAQQTGLNIPPTIIATQKENLIGFIQKNGDCITKAISSMFKIETSNYFRTIGTQLVTDKMIDSLDNIFFPTLLQKKISKIFELRIFYLKGKFYPMAIFSQNDEQTQLDYRNYNRVKPNRNIPFILPKDIETKLQKLMDKLDLDTGSIDIMVTPEGEYVFLEVNPTGQFGWVSENCNYYLEEKIARCLEGEA